MITEVGAAQEVRFRQSLDALKMKKAGVGLGRIGKRILEQHPKTSSKPFVASWYSQGARRSAAKPTPSANACQCTSRAR